MAITLAGVATVSDLNFTPLTGDTTMLRFANALISAGWTCAGSSDGSSFSNAGTNYWVNAAAVAHNQAWIRLKMPTVSGVQREILIQRNTSSVSWRVGYSYSAGFTGTANGAISATVAPTATDGHDWLSATAPTTGGFQGGGATYITHLLTDNTYICNIAAQSAAPYGFWMWTAANTSTTRSLIALDPLVSGSYPSGELEPYVLLGSITANPGTKSFYLGGSNSISGASQVRAWLRKGLTGEGFNQIGVIIPVLNGSNISNTNVVLGPMSYDGQDPLLPVFYGRIVTLAPPSGFKGQSSLFRAVVNTKAVKDTYSASGTKNYVVLGDLAADWDGSTPS